MTRTSSLGRPDSAKASRTRLRLPIRSEEYCHRGTHVCDDTLSRQCCLSTLHSVFQRGIKIVFCFLQINAKDRVNPLAQALLYSLRIEWTIPQGFEEASVVRERQELLMNMSRHAGRHVRRKELV